MAHQGEARRIEPIPIMTQQRSPDDNARAPIDRTRTSRGSGSIGLVLLIAVVLVGAGGRADVDRPRQGRALYSGAARRAGDGRRVPAVRARRRHAAHLRARMPRARCSRAVVDGANEGILVTDARGRVLYANAAYLRAGRGAPVRRTCGRSSACSSAIPAFRKRSSACSRRRAKAAACRKRCASTRMRGEAGALAAHARAPARRRQARSHASRSGRSPTSRASSSGRRTSSRNCSTRSTISTMRRPGSSRSMPPATSPISTPRSPNGSSRIWPRSAPAD